MEKIKKYRGKTFCDFKNCIYWIECKDRLTDEIKKRAFKSKRRSTYPLTVFAKEPDCFRSIEDYLKEIYPLPKNRQMRDWKQKEIVIEGKIAYLPLEHTDELAIIDAEDVNRIKHYRWFYSYQCGNGNQTYIGTGRSPHLRIFLHRLVKGAFPGERVQFIKDNHLDCRKSNLFLRGHRASILKLNDPIS